MVVRVMRTTASVAPWMVGLARSSRLFWPGPWYTSEHGEGVLVG